MIDPSSLRRRATPVDRSGDRWVALGAIGLALAFLGMAAGSLLLPVDARRGLWLPLHLALAGGAATAIAGVMPFFSAAFAAAAPSDVRLRWTAVGAVALGAVAVAMGVAFLGGGVAVAGAVAFIGGIALTGWATVRPLRGALGPSRGLVTEAYVVALVEVALGAVVATLYVAGWPPVLEAWGHLKPAHGWLNLVGFVSLVIGTTLLHFFPTVIGARIATHPTARLTVVGLAAGAPIVALGYVLTSDHLARVGAVLVLTGAAALPVYAGRAWRTRGRWTTDLAWHRFAMIGLASAIAWFEIGIAIAAGRVLVWGADPAGWSIELIAGPLLLGWVGLAVLASATHLIPAIGPGDPATHGRQRTLLGRAATGRLMALDAGIAALTVGVPLRLEPLVAGGAIAAVGGFVATAVLLVAAIGLRVSGGPAGSR